jgi:TetR/AcrR family transcriptional regulator, transcriptional repressor for nem operon
MARPREFNETAAVESTMNCFWQHGYEATSMRDLAASVGMSALSRHWRSLRIKRSSVP